MIRDFFGDDGALLVRECFVGKSRIFRIEYVAGRVVKLYCGDTLQWMAP